MLDAFETTVRSQSDLIADIDAAQPQAGELAVWWLGQHSFVAKTGQTIIYIDPFLSAHPKRQVASLIAPELVQHADIIIGSHDHTDHIDRAIWPTLAAASPQAKFIVPDLLREGLAADFGIPLERLIGMDDGQSLEIAGVKLSALASAHEFLDQDAASGRYPYLGFVFEANGCTWYHPGDTVWYEGLQTKLRAWAHYDLMLLPINGRSADQLRRNIIGNMTYQEAADLSCPLKPRVVIPTHYEMFAGNTADPELFRDYVAVKYPGQVAHRCRHGERILLTTSGQPLQLS